MEIKKCPFCGKEPEFYFKGGTYGYTPDVYYIKCKCGAEMKLVDDSCNPLEGVKNELIKKWNKRSEE